MARTAPLQPLPRYCYQNADRYPNAAIDADVRLRSVKPDLAAVPDTAGYEDAVIDAGKALLKLGRHLGLDLSDRIPGPDNFHFYSPEQSLKARKFFGHKDFSANGSAYPYERFAIVLLDTVDTPEDLASTVGHELIHLSANTEIKLVPDRNEKSFLHVALGALGFKKFRAHQPDDDPYRKVIDETMTEMTTIHMQRKYLPNSKHPKYDEKKLPVSYGPFVGLMDEIITHAPNPPKLFKALERGLFTGNAAALRGVANVIGPDAMTQLEHLELRSNVGAAEIAHKLGYAALIGQISKWGNRKSVFFRPRLLRWIK